jgi:hypothetical protein
MIMHTPPANAGQMVEVSYGSDGCYIYRCTEDRSDRSVKWERISWSDIWDSVPEGSDVPFEPWNSAPWIPRGLKWEPCAFPEEMR